MSSPKANYLPSLDGLRAIAVMIVFVSHAGWGSVVPGGFGVTIFFFLSGYLITSLMRVEYERTATLSLKHFYLRRVYRILPPMYLVLFLLLGLWAIGVLDGPVRWPAVAAQILQSTNYYILYGDSSALVPFTGTFWSLAVEEHFYMVFPLLFLFCVRRWSYGRVALILLALCIVELAWRAVLVQGGAVPDRTYMASDTRLDNMLFGCIMGLWMNPSRDQPPAVFNTLPVQLGVMAVALAVLAASFIVRDPFFRETWRYTLQGAALFPLFWLAVRHPEWPLFRPLNWRLVRLMGNISYVFYLCHFFWLHLFAQQLPGRPYLAVALGWIASVLFSIVVYQLVEQPFARLRRRLHDEVKPAKAGVGVGGLA